MLKSFAAHPILPTSSNNKGNTTVIIPSRSSNFANIVVKYVKMLKLIWTGMQNGTYDNHKNETINSFARYKYQKNLRYNFFQPPL